MMHFHRHIHHTWEPPLHLTSQNVGNIITGVLALLAVGLVVIWFQMG